MNIFQKLLFLFLAICISQIATAQSRTVFHEDFKTKKRIKNWRMVNGIWEIEDKTINGSKNVDWAILLSKKTLPENYILTFSAHVDPKAYLFELITNLNGEKYLGILLNQLENRVAIEDRSLFNDPKAQGSYIHSTGHIGLLPKVQKPNQDIWIKWKVQKTGNQIFIWMNDESVISYTDTSGFIKPKGLFGFAVNGKASIKDIQLLSTKGKDNAAPSDFKGMPAVSKYEFGFF